MNKIFKIVTISSLCLMGIVIGIYGGYMLTSSQKEKLATSIEHAANSPKIGSLNDNSAFTPTPIPEENINKEIENKILINKDTEIIFRYQDAKTGKITEEKQYADYGMIGLNQHQMENVFNNFNMISFNQDKVIMEKIISPITKYIVGNLDGYVAVFYEDENTNLIVKTKTLKVIDSLPETDRNLLKKGIIVYDDIDLVKILQDYTS